MEDLQDKPLNEKESLDLIARMILNTQRKLKEGSGTMFLIWGYATVLVSMLVWTLRMFITPPLSYYSAFFWFLLPITAFPIGLIYKKRQHRKTYAVTFVDKILSYLFTVLGIPGFILSMISIFHPIPILFIIALIFGMGTTLTGLIIKFRLLTIAGSIGMALSVVLTFVGWNVQMPIFAFIFLIMMVIPGHYLNYKAKQEHV